VQSQINGIHHITAIAGDPQRNLDFYTQVLGLRLVKLTINYDAPDTYHFYFADNVGSPGTILTFFPWPGARRGMGGTGQAGGLAFSIPVGSVGFWAGRLKAHDLEISAFQRFDEEGISFRDPDGLLLELVAKEGESPTVSAWQDSLVPPGMAVRGFHGVTLMEREDKATRELLESAFGFHPVGESEGRVRYEADSQAAGRRVDLISLPDGQRGKMGIGVIHHIAWRTPDDAEQLAWREKLVGRGLDVTQVIDRRYFHSIYFREPGGVLFEIATEPPGFAIDEELDCLGTSLRLPTWLEPQRSEIISLLPQLRLPEACPEPA
jgi:glyoxalase family protein